MDVYITSQIGQCSEFVSGNKKQEISIVISPLKITGVENITTGNVLKVNSGCNMWRACENIKCQFSLASRPVLKGTKS